MPEFKRKPDTFKLKASTRHQFENQPVFQAILRNALPAMVSMLVVVLYNMADTFFVGQTGDPNQVAAVSLAMPVFLLFMALGNLIGIGGTSVISRAFGANRVAHARHVSAFCFYSSLTIGIAMILIYWLAMPWILAAIGTRPETLEPTRAYLTYVAPSAPFVIFAIAFSNIARAEGYANRAVVGMMLGTVTNLLLDPILILGFDLQITGAALATLIGNFVSACYYLNLFSRGHSQLSISRHDFRLRGGVMTGVLAIGIPVALNNILMSFAAIVQNNLVADYGNSAVAALGIATRIIILVVLLQIALGNSVQPLLGYCYGAGNRPRFMALMKATLTFSLCLGVVLTAVVGLGNTHIIKSFIDAPQVVEQARHFCLILLISGPLIGWQFVFRNALQATGSARASLILSLCRQGLFFVPLLLLLNQLGGLNGLIFAQPTADMLTMILAGALYLHMIKRLEFTPPASQDSDTPITQQAQ